MHTDTPAARATDPCTSHDAAEQHTDSGNRDHQCGYVLAAMHRYGACHDGITADELAESSGIDRYIVSRRLPELRARGDVRVSGYPESPERRKSYVSGRSAMVWRPKEND